MILGQLLEGRNGGGSGQQVEDEGKKNDLDHELKFKNEMLIGLN